MSTVTARTTVAKPELRPPETGWAKARELRGKHVRTCVPAMEDESAPPRARVGAEWNIIRGDD
ncbi:hypothetical protein [Streptomyces sp. NPDC058964]|uniref:hypothetical protein n=1 Tax=Streptomyces sp. NPDC058964 TaxID=3346681 RepID=UPI00368C0056